MFLSPQQIAQTREHALNNLLVLSTACIDAGQRMNELFADGSRQTVIQGGRHLEVIGRGELSPLAESHRTLWEDNSQTTRFIDAIYEILGATHKALIEAAEKQIKVFDEIVFASIERTSNFSPRETEITLGALRSTLESAERTLHEMSSVAIQTVELAEQEIHQVSESLADKSKNSSKVENKRRKKAE